MNESDIKVTLTPNPIVKTTIAPMTEIKVTVLGSGPRGEPGPAADTFIHNQIVSAQEWTIFHNLEKFPSVTIVDSSGNVVLGNVRYIDNMSILLTFTAPFSGRAYIN